MNTAASRKFFSVAQANQTLPLVRAIVQDIVELFRDVEERRERLTRVLQLRGSGRRSQEATLYTEELEQIGQDLEKDEERLRGFVSELESVGAELKDPRIGLIDFPALYDGREVCLCWKLGEPSIDYWHEVHAGYQGRQSIDADFGPAATEAGANDATPTEDA